MMSKIKLLFSTLIILPLLAIVIIMAVLDSPDIYRETLKERFFAETQLILDIKGDISWRYWPPIAIEISDVSISSAADTSQTKPLASLHSANIDIKLLPLITAGKIAIDGIHIDGLDLNAIIDKSGTPNWEIELAASEAATAADDALTDKAALDTKDDAKGDTKDDSDGFELDVSAISITNSNIEYQDLSAKQHYLLKLESFTLNGLRADQLADISVRLYAEDKIAKLSSDINITGRVSTNKTTNHFSFEQLRIENTLSLPELDDIKSTLVLNGNIDTAKGTAELTQSEFTLSALQILFSINASELFDEPVLKGDIKVADFNALELAQEFKLDLPPMQNPEALNSLALSADINGTSKKMKLSNLQINLDDSKIGGKLTAILEPAMGIDFALNMDQINLSGYLSPEMAPEMTSEMASETAEPAPESKESAQDNTGTSESATSNLTNEILDSEIIPLELLSDIQLKGQFDLAELHYDDYLLKDIKLKLDNKNTKLKLNLNANGYEGNIAMQMDITNIHPSKQPRGNTSLNIQGIDIAKVIETEAMTGTLAMDSKHSFTGSMLSQILASLDGKSNFNVTKGTLDVKPLKKVAADIDKLRGKTSRISTWPDTRPFEHLQGNHLINQGISANQQFAFSLENMNVKGKGGLDYFGNSMDFNIEAIMTENSKGQFPVGPHLANISWPLRCKGSLDAEVSDLCSPDSKGIRKILRDVVKKAAKKAIKEKAQSKVLKKLNVPEESKDQAIQDAREKAKAKAKKLLRGLFD